MSEFYPTPRSLVWKRRLGYLGRFLAGNGPRNVILIYHSVGGGDLSMSNKIFCAQMEWLSRHAEVVSLDTLIATESTTKLRVAITFDDGYQSVFRNVAPLLVELNFPATVYVNSGHIAEEIRQPSRPDLGHYPGEFFMLWSEVSKLQANGWTIGSHGVEHVDLTQLGRSEIDQQVITSKQQIEARLNKFCRHFAYTWGHHNSEAAHALDDAGYSHAVAAFHAPLSSGNDKFALPRMDVQREYSLNDFKAVVLGDWDYLYILHRLKGSV